MTSEPDEQPARHPDHSQDDPSAKVQSTDPAEAAVGANPDSSPTGEIEEPKQHRSFSELFREKVIPEVKEGVRNVLRRRKKKDEDE